MSWFGSLDCPTVPKLTHQYPSAARGAGVSPPSSARSANHPALVSTIHRLSITSHRQLTRATSAVYLCTDLNPHATSCTLQTGLANSIPLNPVLTDLTSSLLPRLRHAVDVLVFNPPYVETYDQEAEDAQSVGVIEKAWAGGVGGMRVTNRLLEVVEVSGGHARNAGADVTAATRRTLRPWFGSTDIV